MVEGFDMPLEINLNGSARQIQPRKGKWQKLKFGKTIETVKADKDYYVEQRELQE